MPSLAFLPLIVSLGVFLVPVYLLQRRAYPRAQDYFVSSEHTPPGVIQNASVANALRMATFGPFFAWGASGDLWPVIIASAFFGVGVFLLCLLRRPMLEFLQSALSRDRSMTVHEFIARQHGNDPRVRLLASGLTVFALFGLVIGESLGMATLLKPIFVNAPYGVVISGIVMLAVLYTTVSGNSGVMRSAQAQLGMLYLGLFGATALLLYLQVSALRPLPPHGILAVFFVGACCTVMIYYRRSRYVDTSPVGKTGSNNSDDADFGREPLGFRLFRRFAKILNACISALAVLVIVLALMQLSSDGPLAALRDSAAALQTGTRMPTIGLIALVLLPLFYPIVDMTNWQRIAAFEKDSNNVESSERPAALRRILRVYAVESPLVWLFMAMFGAIAVGSTAMPVDADVMQLFVQQLASQRNSLAAGALSLLLVSVFAMASSAMSSAFSASLCALRYDILPAFWPEPASGKTAAEATATRRTIIAGSGLYLIAFMAFYIADAYLQISFTSREFLGLLFAFCCAQLSFVPLILGPVIGRTSGGSGSVSPGWALLILASSAAIGLVTVTVYVSTGNEAWLWAAVSACLGSGLLLFVIARLWPGETAGAA